MIKKSLLAILLFFLFSGSAECESPEPPLILTNLSLKASAEHESYVHNGCILTLKGTTTPQATLVSAYITDDQDRMIREVSKRLKINPDTGEISGSIFMGSLREAVSIHLDIKVQDPTGKQFARGLSNKLFIDNGYPEVQIIKPLNQTYCKTAPIMIYGTASDNISGIASVEISLDGGLTYRHVDSFRHGQWEYSFMPTTSDTAYNIKVRSIDMVGLATVSDNLSIHYTPPPPAVKKTAVPAQNKISNYSCKNANKSSEGAGICTYRIINLKKNRFQPTDLFTLKEQMAIIVKGYGGNVVTVRIIDPSSGKVVFELTDYIPANKEKMWEWKLSKTGDFQAELVVNGIEKDDVYFKIIQ